MKPIWIIMLVLGLMLGVNGCGRSTEKSKTDYSATETSDKKLNPMEKEVIEEEKSYDEETYQEKSDSQGEDRGELEAPGEDLDDEDVLPDI